MKRFTILRIFLILSIFLVSPSLCFATPELDEGLVSCDEPNISPDGQKIVFTCDVAYGNIDIWIVNIDGTGLKKLVSGREVVFSPDGTKIAYYSIGGVWIMNPDGTGQTKLDKWPSWYSTCEWFSPDGMKSVFYGDEGLWIKNIDGTGRRQLTFGNYKDSSPSWSPDGTHIIFSSNRGYQPPEPEGEVWRIWRVNIGGTGLRQITEEEFYEPVYSPDGTKIVAVRRDYNKGYNLWIMNADGTNLKRLTNFTNIIEPVVPVKFDPDKWNIAWLKDKGKGEKEGHINCYIGKVEGDPSIGVNGYEVDEIDQSSLELTVKIPIAETYTLSPEGPSQILNSHPGFKGMVLKVKFNKFKAISTLQENYGDLIVGKNYEVLIRGKMKDGQDFSGKATIQIIGGE